MLSFEEMEKIPTGATEIARVDFAEGYAGRGDPPNTYILLGKPAVVFDTGFNSEKNKALFLDALEQCGLSLGDIGYVVLSHWHWDHTGLASWLSSTTEAIFLIHPDEFARVAGTPAEMETIARATENLYLLHGFSAETAAGITALAFELRSPPISGDRIELLQDDRILEVGGASFKVVYSPGHTPGSVCLYCEREGLLLSGDTLYGRLFPHPVAEIQTAELPEYSILREYPRTLERIRKLDAKYCLPGHGAPFSPALKVIDTISRFTERRLDRMVRVLRNFGSEMNAAQILEIFFPKLGPEDLYHSAAEIILLLEVAEDRGLVSRNKNSENVLFFKAT
jgi:glyoxylase-like metal-dependent hydrolase (beta-lactamase superfamily II)